MYIQVSGNSSKQKAMFFSVIAWTLMTWSCAKTDSDNVKTKGIYASFAISGNNQNSVSCTAQFQTGGPTGTFLDLNAGDSVTCNGNSMSRSELAGIITYSATLTYSVGATYTVAFTRSGEGTYTSTVTLPEAIVGMSPANSTSIQKGSALTATWTPSSNSNDNLSVTLSYTAGSTSVSNGQTDTSPENGSLGFSSTQTQVIPAVAGAWAGTLTYKRYRTGSMASGLDGTIQGAQQTSTSLTLTD